jgi:hypothetical protein
MKTKTIEIYSFAELSEEAKEKAIQQFSDLNLYDDWWDCIYEDAEEIGLKITEFDIDRNRYAKGDLYYTCREVAQKIMDNHGELCDTYILAKSFMQDWSTQEEAFNNDPDNEDDDFEDSSEADDLCEEFERALLEEYSCILEKEYEYRHSEAAIIETIEANEYEFTKNGKLYH